MMVKFGTISLRLSHVRYFSLQLHYLYYILVFQNLKYFENIEDEVNFVSTPCVMYFTVSQRIE